MKAGEVFSSALLFITELNFIKILTKTTLLMYFVE